MDSGNAILMTEKEVSAKFGMGLQWLRQRRVTGGGPLFVKIGRKVLYRLSDVQKFVDDRVFASTSEVPANG
jgi:hypothetical protein